MIKKLRALYAKLDTHTAEVLQKSAASTVVKSAGMAIGLGISVFLGRTIGANGLGIINLSNRIVILLMVVGLFGMQQVIIKEVSIAVNKNDMKKIGDVMYTSYWINGGITFSITIIGILLAPWLTLSVFHEPLLKWPLIIALIVMPPQVLSRIFSSGLIGYRKIWQSNLVDQTLSTFIAGVSLIILKILAINITVIHVAIAYAIGRITVTITSGIYWTKIHNFRAEKKFIGNDLIKMALSMLVVNAATLVSMNAPFILLGWLGNAKQVGLFSVSSRLAFITIFLLQVTGSTIAPKIAALYESKRLEEIEIMVQRVTKGLVLLGILVLIFFAIFGKLVLSIWGTEFEEAYQLLLILCLGQFVNLSTGAVGLILVMSGFEKIQSHISISFLFLNLFLSYFLIKDYGALGAAISTTIIMSGENITKVIFAKVKVGITTIPWYGKNRK